MTLNWVMLLSAGALEILCTTMLRDTQGFTRLLPTAGFLVAGAASLYLLNRSINGDDAIPLGTAYAVWTGIGAAGTAIIGLMYYGEPATTARLFFLVLLIASIAGLQVAGRA